MWCIGYANDYYGHLRERPSPTLGLLPRLVRQCKAGSSRFLVVYRNFRRALIPIGVLTGTRGFSHPVSGSPPPGHIHSGRSPSESEGTPRPRCARTGAETLLGAVGLESQWRWLAFAPGWRLAGRSLKMRRAWPLVREQVTNVRPMAARSSGQSEAQMTGPFKHQLNRRLCMTGKVKPKHQLNLRRLCMSAGHEKNYKYH